MHISFFIPTLNGGGIQKATMRLITELLKRNVQVTLVGFNCQGPIRKEIPEGCEFVDLQVSRIRFAFFPLLKYLRAAKPALGISSQTHLNLLMILLRMFTGYPGQLIVREHNTLVQDDHEGDNPLQGFQMMLVRILYPLASKCVAVSSSVAESVKSKSKLRREFRVIHNGINVEEIQTSIAISLDQTWFKEIEKKDLVIGLGRLSYQKNFSLLISAFSHLQNNRNAHLLIMGEGEERQALQALSRELSLMDRVTMPGFVENPYAILSQAKVFVLASRWEGFGNVILEALACGVPIVATDCPGGPADILAGKPFARIVPMGDPAAMATAIREVLAFLSYRDEIIRYAGEFDIAYVAQEYLDLIAGVQKDSP
jgi:glycosyltransferase involved in cell wall biosynthesis